MTLDGLERADARDVLDWAYRKFSRVALVSSFQAESSVLIDMACSVVAAPEVLTLDTGRLPEETHSVMDDFRARYPIRLRVIAPDTADVESMTAEHGTLLFRRSVELRQKCCDVRKVRPLARALLDYDAWITGVRREQSSARTATPLVTTDLAHGGIAKVAPLASWSRRDVWAYVQARELPVHPLYSKGYTSIGCAPCTRATTAGEDERAGRWWWEQPSDKECGLHTLAAEVAL